MVNTSFQWAGPRPAGRFIGSWLLVERVTIRSTRAPLAGNEPDGMHGLTDAPGRWMIRALMTHKALRP
jgi:hypothetical protein